MEDKMMRAMASDLKISSYENETTAQHGRRVLYSAIACWIKAVSMDCPLSQEQGITLGTSRRHINDKCSTVLNEMLKRYPHYQSWFETNSSTENPVNILRSRLLRHGDLVNVGFDTNVALAASERVQLTQHMGCSKGTVLESGSIYSGIATIDFIQQAAKFSPEPTSSAADWVVQYLKNAWWKQTDISNKGVEYFDPNKKSKNNQCWSSTLPDEVANVVLARHVVNKNDYEYLLYKPSELKIHRIDPFLKEQREYRRFMIGMRVLARNHVPITIIRYPDHINLKLRIHLPVKENILLESYAWPHNSITDKLEWDMSFLVWEYIKQYMTGIGLAIVEEIYG
ncbi:hypothetical protein LJC42_00095 [Eubacteriales bacterium OttesenSCG-928-K08]|nr:hypothetical protein [Eubacteriales bacterium OttesenSCG-928-K08]